MDRTLDDLRYALRILRKSPGFTTAAVGVLAVGIGASTAVFSVVDHILFRPLDLPNAHRLVTVCETHESLRDYCVASTPNVLDWSARAESFEALGTARGWGYSFRTDQGARFLNAGIATPSFLRALGFTAARGRLFGETDGPPNGPGRVAVLTHAFWSSEFGADPRAIGRTIVLDEEPYEVIGVLSRGATAPRLDYVSVWLPMPWDPATEENRDWRGFITIGRLAPDVELPGAESELAVAHAALAEAYPETVEGYGVEVRPLREHLVGDVRPTLLVFLAAVGVVLLIVCVNMAALLMARATARLREMAVRSALGARSAQLVRQILTETTLLALLGGAGGALLATWGTRALVAVAPAGIPRLDEVAVDARVLGFAILAALAVGVLFGLVPALSMRRMELNEILREGRSRSSTLVTSRLRRALVIGELALAMVLLASAGVLIRSFAELSDWNPGFEVDGLLTLQVFPSSGTYETPGEVLSLYRDAERALATLPGVQAVGTASAGPLFGGGDGAAQFLIEGKADWTVETAPSVLWFDVGPGYFETLGLPLLSGRPLTEADDASAPPVALINEAMARRYWPGDNPLGARISLPMLETTVDVVGVVGNVEPFFPERPPEPELYLSNRQRTRWATYFLVRTAGDPASLSGPVVAALQRLDPDLGPTSRTMEEHVGARLVRPRFNMILVGSFAGIALLLGLAGVYALIAYTVELRRRDIGIRLALGARRERVLKWILGDGLRLVLVGLALGVVAALAATRTLSSMLHGVSPTDPLAFAGTALLLALTGLAACAVPAVRASRVDPLAVLREE